MSIQCYNKGCGKKFDPDQNNDGSCQHHPGIPVFHDALKGWSCCKKRSTDFTEFLNIPGCTYGLHSNEKPPEPEKPAPEANEEIVSAPKEVEVRPIEKMPRPSADNPRVRLKCNVATSLQQALEKHLSQLSITQEAEEIDPSNIPVGTSCKNPACKQEYKDESTNSSPCVHHPGVPIFHEGMKFWSCCNRKTSDFNTFLNQEGCETGKHLWVKKDSTEKKVACRMDWHQTATFVTISVFAKVALPDQSYVDINKVSGKIHITFDGGKSQFSKELAFFGVVDPERSNVKMLGTKVEINMRKLEPGAWKTLELEPTS